MNLEALALARAEEQMRSDAWREPEPPAPRGRHAGPRRYTDPASRPRAYSLTRRTLVCRCGNCHTCKNREAMRRRRGSPKPTAFKRCEVHGCMRGVHGKGLCVMHYRQQWRGGSVAPGGRRPRKAREATIQAARAKLAAKGIYVEGA